MGKRNASKYIKLVKDNFARSYVGRKPTRPSGPPLVEVGGWAAFRHRYGPKDSRLWVPIKVVHVAALQGPKRRGTRRTFWLYWGVDCARFRRSNDRRLYLEQVPAEVRGWIETACRNLLTVEQVTAEIGEEAVLVERSRLRSSTAKRERLCVERLARAHEAALEEDSAWNALYRD